MAKFNKDMTIGEVLDINPEASTVLTEFGMHCFGCPMSQAETLEEAASVHDADVDLIIKKLEELSEQEKCCCSCCEENECEDDCDCGCK